MSDEEGSMEFFLGAVNDPVGSLYNRARRLNPEPIGVKSFGFSQWIEATFSLDDFIILSLDIQGGEYRVLEKMVADSTMQYIDRMYVDVHPEIALRTVTEHSLLIQQISDAGVFVHYRSGEQALRGYGWIDTLLDPPTLDVPGVDFVDAGAPVPLEAEATARRSGPRVERVEFLVDGGRRQPAGTLRGDVDGPRHWASPRDGRRPRQRGQRRGIRPCDLDLGGPGVAMRFTEIRIPRGAQIEKAHVQFTADDAETEPTDLIIQAELAGNGMAPGPVDNDLSSRTRTAASVTWSPEPWDVARERSVKQRTPDLAALIQEVVDGPDWQEGNAFVLLISGSGDRDAWSYDRTHRRERAPRLYIELAEGDAPSPGP